MTENVNPTSSPVSMVKARLMIRVGYKSLSFSVVDGSCEEGVRYEPYTVKSGISMAANLRQAFLDSELLCQGYTKAGVLQDAPSLLVPVEQFQEEDLPALYGYTFEKGDSSTLIQKVMPAQNAVAIFPINKDLKLVIEDHFQEVRYSPVCMPVWNYFQQRGLQGQNRKLYGYFHDKKLDIFCFDKQRFRFSNSYEVAHGKDAVYFLLYVWQQLQFDAHKDELNIAGDLPNRAETLEQLKRYVRKVFLLNPVAEFNRAPVTRVKDLPFDLLTYFLRR